MATKWSPKDPADVCDLWFNWDNFLPSGLTITTETTVVDEPGLTKVNDNAEPRRSRVRVSGGDAGTKYPITNTITTNDGQIFQVTKVLEVKERVK